MDNKRFADYYPSVQHERDLIIGSVVSEFIKTWDRNGKVLIAGCGTGGTMLDLWQRWFNNYYGVDLNLAAIKRGQLENRLVQADINNLPFGGDTFDYAVAADVFQDYSTFDGLVDALKNVARVVKNKGQILVINPTAESYIVETRRFDCSKFPENAEAVKLGMGRKVKGIMKAIGREGEKLEFDFVDYVYRDKDLEIAFKLAGLRRMAKARPKARDDRNLPDWMGVHGWVSEIKTAPWVVYLLERD